MNTLFSSGLPLSKLMEFSLHRLDSGLDVVPRVPWWLMMNSLSLMYLWHVYCVHLMNWRLLFSCRCGSRRGRRSAGNWIKLIVPVDTPSVDRVLDVSMGDFGTLVLKLQPSSYQWRWWWPVRRWSPLCYGAATPGTLVLLGGVFAAKAGTAGPAFRRRLKIRRCG